MPRGAAEQLYHFRHGHPRLDFVEILDPKPPGEESHGHHPEHDQEHQQEYQQAGPAGQRALVSLPVVQAVDHHFFPLASRFPGDKRCRNS
jgi:hypothetical protein